MKKAIWAHIFFVVGCSLFVTACNDTDGTSVSIINENETKQEEVGTSSSSDDLNSQQSSIIKGNDSSIDFDSSFEESSNEKDTYSKTTEEDDSSSLDPGDPPGEKEVSSSSEFMLQPTCDDGEQNGLEADVDCGGDCDPCGAVRKGAEVFDDVSGRGFSNCKFNYGQDWQGDGHDYPDNVTYIREWLGYGEDLSGNHHGMLNACKAGGRLDGVTPMFIGYLIAFSARADMDLQDCDVADREGRSTSLCTHGTQYMRDNKQKLLDKHRRFARSIGDNYGRDKPVIWMTEPDYFQYADEPKQEGGSFTYQEAGDYLRDLMVAIKEELPNVIFALDVAPWLRERAQKWFDAMPLDMIDYLTLYGTPTELIQNGDWSNSYTEFYEISGKPIMTEGWEYNSPAGDWHSTETKNTLMDYGIISESFRQPPTQWDDHVRDGDQNLDMNKLVSCQQ